MKAAILSKYGSPEVLHIKEKETPTQRINEVLIRLHATAINRNDCHVRSGKPFMISFYRII